MLHRRQAPLHRADRGPGPGERRAVRVWDLPLRLFHWLLVALVAAGALIGFLAPEWWMGVHLWVGYGIVVLLAFRLVWGIFGSEYSRIASFAYPPRAVAEHVRGLAMLRPSHHLGHNPAGAVMVFALFIALTAISVTGLLVLGGEENAGPLAGLVGYRVGTAAKEVHEALVILVLAMVAAHLLGVLVESRRCRDNLVRAMITGDKTLPEGAPRPNARGARPRAAALSLAAVVLTAGGLLALAARVPPLGLVAMPANDEFRSECGDCHIAFHPSLLPRDSWRGLMAALDDHFGEDAGLAPDVQARITRYLAAYAGEAWDTEAANRFREVSAGSPWRITATPYWREKHRGVDEGRYADKRVRSRSNCLACHKDADSGRFDDQNISMPEI